MDGSCKRTCVHLEGKKEGEREREREDRGRDQDERRDGRGY